MTLFVILILKWLIVRPIVNCSRFCMRKWMSLSECGHVYICVCVCVYVCARYIGKRQSKRWKYGKILQVNEIKWPRVITSEMVRGHHQAINEPNQPVCHNNRWHHCGYHYMVVTQHHRTPLSPLPIFTKTRTHTHTHTHGRSQHGHVTL